MHGTAIVVMAEPAARTVRTDGVVVVPLSLPPQYVLALAWRRDEQAGAARRCLDCLRSCRDRNGWIGDRGMAARRPGGAVQEGRSRKLAANSQNR